MRAGLHQRGRLFKGVAEERRMTHLAALTLFIQLWKFVTASAHSTLLKAFLFPLQYLGVRKEGRLTIGMKISDDQENWEDGLARTTVFELVAKDVRVVEDLKSYWDCIAGVT